MPSRPLFGILAAAAVVLLPAQKPEPAASPRAAVERSLPLRQEASVRFLKASKCVSCHHNTLTVTTLAMARSGNIRVDEDLAFEQQELISDYVAGWDQPTSAGPTRPTDVATVSNVLLGLSVDGFPADDATDWMVGVLLRQQANTGEWRATPKRFSGDSETIAVTAAAIRALQVYASKRDRAGYDAVMRRAMTWLENARPQDTEGRAHRLLGLDWSHASTERISQAARDLIATQRADGGWSQVPGEPSDAYATGQALFTLVETGALAPDGPVYARGAEFLLGGQFEDGSWLVKSRATKLQPHVDTGFPFGPDQFSSIAATNWATMALALAR